MERGSVLDDVIERATEGRGCSAVQCSHTASPTVKYTTP